MEIRIRYGPPESASFETDQNTDVSKQETPEQEMSHSKEKREKFAQGKGLFKVKEKLPAITPENQTKLLKEDPKQEFECLIGLEQVKLVVQELEAFVTIQKYRKEKQLATNPMAMHMIFRGNPGTGKTTVARYLGKIFLNMGILSKGHLVEVERADLVGEYIGHTAQKTKEHIKKALGGILFIDEAYSLARGGEKDFGKEAIDVLVKGMEDHKDEFVLILAGYYHEMDCFLRTNPGLRSRFPVQLEFPDYSLPELMAIGELMLKKREYLLTPEARAGLEYYLRQQSLFGKLSIGNARLIRNLVEKAVRRQAVRLVSRNQVLSRDDLVEITAADIRQTVQILQDTQELKFSG